MDFQTHQLLGLGDISELTFSDETSEPPVQRVYGWRVATNGRWYVDVLVMGFNYRAVLTDKADADEFGNAVAYDGHGWCYPKSTGLLNLVMLLQAWVIDPTVSNANRVEPPPGPWIKSTFTGEHR